MSPDLAATIERVTQLRRELASTATTDELLALIDDVLTDGYAQALTGEAWSTRTEQRMHELITNAGAPIRGSDLRAVATEHAGFQRELVALRRELTGLWHARDRLRAGARSPSA